MNNVQFFKNYANSNTFTVDVSKIAKFDHYHYGLLIYVTLSFAKVIPFTFCLAPAETFIYLNDSSVSATIENKTIKITIMINFGVELE